ncbi:MAG: helix-turn-helix transcriptional regulator [Bacteroidota bacterium]
MLEILGSRQKELLTLLLKNKAGLTVDELAQRLGITRNAVRQHLGALENERLITTGTTRPSGGRPEQLYVLADKGREVFPRHYSWFAQLVVESIKQDVGSEGLRERLGTLGAAIGSNLRHQQPVLADHQQQVEKLSEVMEQLGYSTTSTTAEGAPVIEADNCVFHNLAIQNPEVCQFDLALLASFTGSEIDHQECMANGGHVCRFKFTKKNEES